MRHDLPRCDTPVPLLRRHLLLAAAAAGLGGCSRQESAPAAQATGRAVDDPTLLAAGMLLPGLVNSSTDGALIDLVREMGQHYSRGPIVINAFPVARVLESAAQGVIDLGFPWMRATTADGGRSPYRCSTEPYGRVNFVLYSNRRKPVTRALIEQQLRQGHMDLSIEAPAFDWRFPYQQFINFESAFRKLVAGRLDALLWAQEEADLVLRQMQLSDIRRENYGDFDDVFLLPPGPRGDAVDRIVTDTLGKLRQSGRLQALYRRIHLPHDPWQP